MDIILAILVLLFAIKILVDIRRFRKYIELRFKLFRLRDRILCLAVNGHISKEEAVRHYNTVNWSVRYVREFPVFFLIGLVRTYEHLNLPETQEELKTMIEKMHPELKDWYAQLSDLTIKGIKSYTPIESVLFISRIGIFEEVANFCFAFWFLLMMIRLRKHPLRRSVIGRISFDNAKKESHVLSQTSNSAMQLKQLSMGVAR